MFCFDKICEHDMLTDWGNGFFEVTYRQKCQTILKSERLLIKFISLLFWQVFKKLHFIQIAKKGQYGLTTMIAAEFQWFLRI